MLLTARKITIYQYNKFTYRMIFGCFATLKKKSVYF
nr:MAG TPA: hypothetical protein [Caudoviricetes sp.]